MAITQLGIINLALIELGHSAVQSLEGSDALVQAAVAIWDIKLPSVLSSGNWRFAHKGRACIPKTISYSYANGNNALGCRFNLH